MRVRLRALGRFAAVGRHVTVFARSQGLFTSNCAEKRAFPKGFLRIREGSVEEASCASACERTGSAGASRCVVGYRA
ncbi:hypothetical protein B5F40_13145 [Gordonibacter sp. An230]|nr:hypothetical protein B5F40_13145 [Gordonibacter sp. An230]